MPDYYEILGVERNASLKKIRCSFRKKAKLIHPDVSKKTKQEAEESMRHLLNAYRVLSNSQRRRAYNDQLRRDANKVEFNYREFLRGKIDDLDLQAKLVFYDILNGDTEDAINLYENLCGSKEFRLEDHLGYGDFMDCSFLLAEEFDRQKSFLKSFLMFQKVFTHELGRPYFHHFSEEIVDRLRSLVTNKLQHMLSTEDFLELLENLLLIDFQGRDKAVFCKKIAEVHSRTGNRARAQEYLRRGLCYDKKLPGTKKLSLKIGLAEIKP